MSLPTSSGKTFIAEFRILQALNQFDQENGWVAYLAPTRALVNQLATRLRRDFSPLGTVVEKVSPALEVDGLEAGMLTEADSAQQFRILVTTPEKLDLMLRGGWEEKIGRPLTLVVVDEAHGLASADRGIKLELLLATINRECRYAQFLCLHRSSAMERKSPAGCRPTATRASTSASIGRRTIALWRSPVPNMATAEASSAYRFASRHTTRNTLDIPEQIGHRESRPLGLAWSNGSQIAGEDCSRNCAGPPEARHGHRAC